MARKYLCGTPAKHCNGSLISTTSGLGKSILAHSSRVEAFKCYRRHKIDVEGYEMVGSRELRAPDGSGVLVMSKQSKFGSELRRGKNQDGNGNRYQPKVARGAGTFV